MIDWAGNLTVHRAALGLPRSGLVLHYDFVAGASPSVVYDQSGHGRNGHFVGSGYYRSGQGLWTEKDTYVVSDANLGISGDPSFSLLVYAAPYYHIQILGFGQLGAGSQRASLLTSLSASGKLVSYIAAGSVATANSPVSGMWQVLGLSKTPGADTLATTRLHINGVAQALSSPWPTSALNLANHPLTLCYDEAGYGSPGHFRAAVLYSPALTDAQMAQAARYFLRRRPPRQIFFDGDSLTAAAGLRPSDGYPWQLIKSVDNTLTWGSVAVGGQLWEDIIASAPAKIDSGYQPAGICVVWCGTNEPWKSGTAMFNLAAQYCQARRAAGFKVIVLSMIPYSWQSQTNRQDYNTLLRSSWSTIADGFADVAAHSAFSASDAYTNTTYYQADQTHPTAAGQAIVAGVVAPVFQPLLLL